MDCREFRKNHLSFVDDTLPMVQMDAMRRHVRACRCCARQDTAVRRSLLVARNLPSIEPSADFMVRLNARIHNMDVTGRTEPLQHRPPLVSFAAVAVALALAAYVALETSIDLSGEREIRMAPVVASIPEPPPSPATNPAFMASVSTGMPIWPAVMMLEQAPIHLVNMQIQQASLSR